jgi:membrane associated rhomboid family serine protease
MIPLRDDVPVRLVPVVTLSLIFLNLLVFAYQALLGIGPGAAERGALQAFVTEFGLIPCRLTEQCVHMGDRPSPALTIFTSMFLHAGIIHLLGNSLYLWIFGASVESALGRARFLTVYLASGVGGALVQVVASPDSSLPMLGASGAVSGALGAYLLLFPHARVHVLLLILPFARLAHIPALLVLGLWIVVQLVSGVLAARAVPEEGGVACFAHLGGFVAGMALLGLFRPRRRPRFA